MTRIIEPSITPTSIVEYACFRAGKHKLQTADLTAESEKVTFPIGFPYDKLNWTNEKEAFHRFIIRRAYGTQW